MYKIRDRPKFLGSESGIVLEAGTIWGSRFALQGDVHWLIGNEEKHRKTLMYQSEAPNSPKGKMINEVLHWSFRVQMHKPLLHDSMLTSSSLTSNALLWAWCGPGLAKTHGYNHI